MVAHEVLAGRRDLGEHACDVFHGVYALRLRETVGELAVFLPGSANRESLVVASRLEPEQ